MLEFTQDEGTVLEEKGKLTPAFQLFWQSDALLIFGAGSQLPFCIASVLRLAYEWRTREFLSSRRENAEESANEWED